MPNSYRVLIIEGSSTAHLFVAQILVNVGYQISVASSGIEGVRRAFNEVPHCILLDAMLPDVSGFEVCRKLRASDPNHRHPIILMSSKDTSLDHSWGLKQGADYYLASPFKEERLLQAVQYVLSPLFHPPVDVRQLTEGNQPVPSRPIQPLPVDWTLFVPSRREEPNLLTTDNPFETASVIRDRSARRAYDAIDGRKNIRDICQVTGLPLKVVLEALRLLLKDGRIQLYASDGTPIDASFLPKN